MQDLRRLRRIAKATVAVSTCVEVWKHFISRPAFIVAAMHLRPGQYDVAAKIFAGIDNTITHNELCNCRPAGKARTQLTAEHIPCFI